MSKCMVREKFGIVRVSSFRFGHIFIESEFRIFFFRFPAEFRTELESEFSLFFIFLNFQPNFGKFEFEFGPKFAWKRVESWKKKFGFEFGSKFALIRLNSFEFGLVRFGFGFQPNSEFESDQTGNSKKACDRFAIFTVLWPNYCIIV
jgi:hypothetical protein